jgi:hypothetical protein
MQQRAVALGKCALDLKAENTAAAYIHVSIIISAQFVSLLKVLQSHLDTSSTYILIIKCVCPCQSTYRCVRSLGTGIIGSCEPTWELWTKLRSSRRKKSTCSYWLIISAAPTQWLFSFFFLDLFILCMWVHTVAVQMVVVVGDWIFRTSACSDQLHSLSPYVLRPKGSFIIIHKYTVADFWHTRRGRQTSLQVVVSHHVFAGIWTQDLQKSSLCSYPLSHLASPWLFFLCVFREYVVPWCVWRSENNLQELVFSFPNVGPWRCYIGWLGTLWVDQAVASNSQNAGIKVMHHHVWLSSLFLLTFMYKCVGIWVS